MFMKLMSWLLSLIFAFSLGTGIKIDKETNSELQQKVQDHMDVIVDEAAAIIDDVTEEIRKNEHVQDAEAFVDDVKEIISNTKDDIKNHFGSGEDASEEDASAQPAEDAPSADPQAEAPEEASAEQHAA